MKYLIITPDIDLVRELKDFILDDNRSAEIKVISSLRGELDESEALSYNVLFYDLIHLDHVFLSLHEKFRQSYKIGVYLNSFDINLRNQFDQFLQIPYDRFKVRQMLQNIQIFHHFTLEL